MSNKRRQFSSEFKVKLILEVLKNEKPLNQIVKEQIKELEKKVDKYARTVGKLTVKRNCPRPSVCGVVTKLGRAVGKHVA